MAWKKMRLRGAEVFARVDADGGWVLDGGRVDVRYKRVASRAYLASPGNLVPDGDTTIYPDEHCRLLDDPTASTSSATSTASTAGAPSTTSTASTANAAASGGAPRRAAKPKRSPDPPATHAHADGHVVAYADGACSGNPGPAGLGVVVHDGAQCIELSEYLGHGTNNVAELTAIVRALEIIGPERRPSVIRTDSQYSIGVISKGWKAKANRELVASLRAIVGARPWVKFEYVPGHAGVALNERADELARDAVKHRKTHRTERELLPAGKHRKPDP